MTSLIHPNDAKSQVLLHKFLDKTLRNRLLKLRSELITKHSMKFRVENPDLEMDDARVTLLSHYYIRGIDPYGAGGRARGIEDGRVLFRRGGLDIKYAIDNRENIENANSF